MYSRSSARCCWNLHKRPSRGYCTKTALTFGRFGAQNLTLLLRVIRSMGASITRQLPTNLWNTSLASAPVLTRHTPKLWRAIFWNWGEITLGQRLLTLNSLLVLLVNLSVAKQQVLITLWLDICNTASQPLHIAVFVNKVIYLIFEFSYVPSSFGYNYIVPIPKPKDCHNKSLTTDDFRGIIISSPLSKIYESCISFINVFCVFFLQLR